MDRSSRSRRREDVQPARVRDEAEFDERASARTIWWEPAVLARLRARGQSPDLADPLVLKCLKTMRGRGESDTDVIPAVGERVERRLAAVVDAERPRLLSLGKVKQDIGQPSPCFATSLRDDRPYAIGVRRRTSGRCFRPALLDVLAILQDLDLLQRTSPLGIMEFRIGRNALMLSSVSTISITSGKSRCTSRIFMPCSRSTGQSPVGREGPSRPRDEPRGPEHDRLVERATGEPSHPRR